MRDSCSRQRYSHILTHIKIRIAESKTWKPRQKLGQAKTGHRGKTFIQGTFLLLWFAINGNHKAIANFLIARSFYFCEKREKKRKEFLFQSCLLDETTYGVYKWNNHILNF